MDLTLVSIVVGLGLTELLLTFYHLVQARRRVTWDALPLAWAALVLVAVVNFWWGIRAVTARAQGWTSGDFMLIMVPPVFLFLACAAALPRPDDEARTDMKGAYEAERPVFLLYFLGYQAGTWLIDLFGLAGPLSPIVAGHRAAICVALAIALAGRSRRWSWVAVVLIAGAYVSRLLTQMAT